MLIDHCFPQSRTLDVFILDIMLQNCNRSIYIFQQPHNHIYKFVLTKPF